MKSGHSNNVFSKIGLEIGILCIVGGIFLLSRTLPIARFFGAMFAIFGTQFSLWSVRLRLEILGNVPPNKRTSRQIRSMYAQQVEDLKCEALLKHGQLSSGKVDNLERLEQIVKVTPPIWKLWLISLIIVVLIIIVLLLPVRVSETEIELDLTMTEVGFVLSEPVRLIDAIELAEVGVTELREIRLPRISGWNPKVVDNYTGANAVIRLSNAQESESGSTITLSELILPAGTRIGLSLTGIPNQYRIFLQLPENTPLELKVSVTGTVQVALSGEEPQEPTYSTPKSIHMKSFSNTITLDLTLPDGLPSMLSPQIASKALSFIRTDQFMDIEGSTHVRRVSTILSGSLSFSEINHKVYELRPGESIQFEESNGTIRILTLAEAHLAMQFHGHVSGMTTGWNERQPLMPLVLEWLSARNDLNWLWAAIGFVAGAVFLVLRIMRI